MKFFDYCKGHAPFYHYLEETLHEYYGARGIALEKNKVILDDLFESETVQKVIDELIKIGYSPDDAKYTISGLLSKPKHEVKMNTEDYLKKQTNYNNFSLFTQNQFV